MNYVYIQETRPEYQDDVYDVLQCNTHIEYANMFKQLCNNAVHFGVLGNVIWILGYTNFVETEGKLFENKGSAYLKLSIAQFYKNQYLNTLVLDTTTIRSYGLSDFQDNIDKLDEFIGSYFNPNTKSLEFVFYNKLKQTVVNRDVYALQEIPLRVYQYEFENPQNSYIDVSISGVLPAINLFTEDIAKDFQFYKSSLNTPTYIENNIRKYNNRNYFWNR